MRVQDPMRARRDLCAVTAGLLAVLLVGYVVMFDIGRLPSAAWWINGGIAGTMIVLMAIAVRTTTSVHTVEESTRS